MAREDAAQVVLQFDEDDTGKLERSEFVHIIVNLLEDSAGDE